jgi:uncharacterized membrane protein YciS (DUF1049 family)
MKSIYGIICLLGFILVAGTVGAMEQDTISFQQAILQSGAGLVLFAGAGKLGGFVE